MRYLLFWVFVAFYFSLTAAAEQSDRVRILALMDTQAGGIGASVQEDAQMLSDWYDSVFESDELPGLKGRADIHFLGTHSELSPDLVRWYFREHPLRRGEALIVFYSGHGAMDSGRVVGGQFLAMSGGNYSGWELSKEMLKQGANLNVLIVDACSNQLEGPFRQYLEKKYITGPNPTEEYYKDLFFRSRGFFVANAAQPGKSALGLPGLGGFFIHSLMEVMAPERIAGVGDDNGRGSWMELFREAREETIELSKEYYEQVSKETNDAKRLAKLRSIVPQEPILVNAMLSQFNGKAEVVRFEWREDVAKGGLSFHSLFKVYNLQGHQLNLVAFFYDRNNQPLKWNDGSYVKASKMVSPGYQNTYYLDPDTTLNVTYAGMARLPDFVRVRLHVFHGQELLAVSKFIEIERAPAVLNGPAFPGDNRAPVLEGPAYPYADDDNNK